MRLVVFAMLLGLGLWAEAQPARIIVIRHAEKPADTLNQHLSEEGQFRARRLVRWLTQGKVLDTNGAPAALYAAEPTRRGRSVRCVETLTPTAEKLGLKISTPYAAGDFEYLARKVLHDKSLRGKNIVICWVHEYLPELAVALGVTPKPSKWDGDDFESAYVITFPKGKAELERTKQRLKKDSKEAK
jgi:hypothetical protein